jgi:hypothetical protein
LHWNTVRDVFVIGSDKKIKLILVYPMTMGRSFDEEAARAPQLTAKHRVATPVNGTEGDDVIIAGSVTDAAAARSTRKAGRRQPYIRLMPYPRGSGRQTNRGSYSGFAD